MRVLLTDTNRWGLAARLAIGLAECGCEVSAICPSPSHALTKTSAVRRTFRYSAFHPLEALKKAIDAVDPDIVVPSCDRSVEHLHQLYAEALASNGQMDKIRALIERSLGSPESHQIVSSRLRLIEVAREEGIRVPRIARIAGKEDLDAWSAQESFPWVSKADGTWGGSGVRIVKSAEEAETSMKQLEQMARFTRAFKRLLVNRDAFLFRPWWNRSRRSIVVQSYIQGRPANCTVLAWKGRVLAMIGVEVVRSQGLTGPASIVRIVDNEQMRSAAEKLAARLHLSGFFGLDFMIESSTGAAFLIEMNPRLAPPCHLRLDKGRDLAGALWAQLADQNLPASPLKTQSSLIAYFPQNAHNPSEIPAACFLDAPEGEPELTKELLNPFPDRTLLFRLVQRISRIRSRDEDFATSNSGAVVPSASPSEMHPEGATAGGMDRPTERARIPLV
jgi:ATP-grasp domain